MSLPAPARGGPVRDRMRDGEALEQLVELAGTDVDVQLGLAGAELPGRGHDVVVPIHLRLIDEVQQAPLALAGDQLLAALAVGADGGAGVLLARPLDGDPAFGLVPVGERLTV